MTVRQELTIMNAPQNINQIAYDRPNMVGNLSIEFPTVEQLNAAISAGQSPQVNYAEPAFGEHIREAVDAVKRVFTR